MCTAYCPVSNFTVFWFIDRKVLLCRSKNLIPLGIRRWWNQYEITIYVLKCTTYSNYFGFPKLHNLVAHLLIPNNIDVILCLYTRYCNTHPPIWNPDHSSSSSSLNSSNVWSKATLLCQSFSPPFAIVHMPDQAEIG